MFSFLFLGFRKKIVVKKEAGKKKSAKEIFRIVEQTKSPFVGLLRSVQHGAVEREVQQVGEQVQVPGQGGGRPVRFEKNDFRFLLPESESSHVYEKM